MKDIPKVLDILKIFKDECRLRGWKPSQNEELINVNGNYHNFLWVKSIHPSTFTRVAANPKFAVKSGLSYKVVQVSYVAWLFQQPPPNELLQLVYEKPEIAKHNAIYDLSWTYAGKPYCLKINFTGSIVFKEFEEFLKRRLGVKVRPMTKTLTRGCKA